MAEKQASRTSSFGVGRTRSTKPTSTSARATRQFGVQRFKSADERRVTSNPSYENRLPCTARRERGPWRGSHPAQHSSRSSCRSERKFGLDGFPPRENGANSVEPSLFGSSGVGPLVLAFDWALNKRRRVDVPRPAR